MRGSALFRGTRMRGTLALPGARIGDDLDLFAAHIDRADAVAVDAGGVQINGDLVLRRCEVRGRVELVGAHVPGDADFSGAIITAPGEIELNTGAKTVTLKVANTGDRPIQVGSHYHFFETNGALRFDRDHARGMRLDIAAGTAVRFEPGQERDVTLVPLGGRREVYGFQQKVMGKL